MIQNGKICVILTQKAEGVNTANRFLCLYHARLQTEKPAPHSRMTVFMLVQLNQNRISANPFDAIPGNDEIVFTAEKTPKFRRTRNHNRNQPPNLHINQYIAREPETAAVADINDLLAPDIGNPALMAAAIVSVMDIALHSNRLHCSVWVKRLGYE
jgi:hypothetical protein